MLSTLFLPILLSPLGTLAQLTLPDPPWLPPDASAGAVASNGSAIPNAQWSTLLGDLIFFYDAQRSGKLPETNRVSWRNDSALDDGKDVGLDLSGGYYDAGDYVKFTYPLSFTLMSICWGALDFGKGYDLANQTAYLDSALRWGLDWLIKAHPSNNTLYVQVGDADTDNAYWGGDQGIPTPRYSYQINDTSPGTDTAASTSAAFSSCSLLYSNNTSSLSPASLQNETYSTLLLSHAESLYHFATSASAGLRLTQKSVPSLADAYSSSAYGDDLALAALFLAWASGSKDRYQDAQGYYSQYGLSGQDSVLNWDDRTSALPILFAQVNKVAPDVANGANMSFSDWQRETEEYFDRIIDGKSQGKLTKGGLLYYKGVSDSASLNPALNVAMLMTRYASLSSSDEKRTSYQAFASNQLSYALGKNPMSAPYIVGVNPNSPRNPHTAIASGGSDIGNIDTSPPEEAYIIYGAVVGGPDRNDRFWDVRSDWIQGEVALDYNAPLLTLAAAHVMNDTTDPFYTSLRDGEYDKKRPKGRPCDDSTNCNGQVHLATPGKIVIGVVIGFVGLVIVALIATWAFCLSRHGSLRTKA